MSMIEIMQRFESERKINPPRWMNNNIHYLGMVGSIAYGASSDMSDVDVQGICIPPKNYIFPHLAGHINGFGLKPLSFDIWQEHHVEDRSSNREYDFSIYSIIKFFNLAMENNPNILDLLFLPTRCILHSTKIGNIIRDNRKLFVHKGSYHKFRGYAHSSLSKLMNGQNSNANRYLIDALINYENELGIPNSTSYNDILNFELNTGNKSSVLFKLDHAQFTNYKTLYNNMISANKRLDSIKRFGIDVKWAYHIVRLLLQCEQLMLTGDMDIERDSEIYKSIRRGEWDLDRIKSWYANKEKQLEELYAKTSIIPHSSDEDTIKRILIQCLEEHYGSLHESGAVVDNNRIHELIFSLDNIISKFR